MPNIKRIQTPLTAETIENLYIGDSCLISGTIYTARDAAHKRMLEMLERGEEMPFDFRGQIIYYAGPCPNKPGHVIGPIGPTTSGRMDRYSPALIDAGLIAMMGKGLRDEEVKEAIVRNHGVYFAAIGGAAALLAECVKEAETIAFEDLGTEAIRKLRVENFPAFVAIDSEGNDLYRSVC